MSYHDEILKILEDLDARESANVAALAVETKNLLDAGGVLFVFGAGHSSMLAEEAFHRAGGLVPVYPVYDESLSPRVRPEIASAAERKEGVAAGIFSKLGARRGDMMFIASNSGINAAGIEMALAAKAAGLLTVAVTSVSHSKAVKSRHSSGKRLFELTDRVLDNHLPPGDALVAAGAARVAPGSTMVNAWLWNSLVAEVSQLYAAAGSAPPVYLRANLPGGDAHNAALQSRYAARIPLL